MKILLVNYRYFISGGPEKYMFNIKKILEENGHEVIPFSIHSNKNIKTKYSKYFVEPIGNRDTTYYDELKKTPKVIWQLLTRSIYSFDVKRKIKEEIKDVKPDLVYIIHFVNKLSPSVISGAKEMKVPVVLRLSDYFMLCPRCDFLYNKEVCDVTPSQFLKKKLIENGYTEEKINYIPTFTVNNYKEDNKIGEYGLYFGRISVEKGIETLVKAYKELPNYELKIMGDDTSDEAMKVKKYIKENNIRNVDFLGFKSGKELDEIIDNARFSLIPSIWYDNLPNVALESFIHGKPVIASNIGSLPELVEDGYNGYLFEAKNEKDLIEKIKQLDDDNLVKLMGKNSKKQLIDKFSKEKHYEKLIELFNSLTKGS